MKIFKTKNFERWARKEKLDDIALVKAVAEIVAGLYEADLGGGLFKKRIARSGRGKSGGYRTIVATNKSARYRWVFLYGYAKNVRDNITEVEKEDLKDFASLYLSFSAEQIELALQNQLLFEVIEHEEEISDNGGNL
ncbi:type II toxin-antitoxin system RelE/ParE family toxin [Merismopedia glauca]|uniref:Type II toxin-antitoxin system RelE/ParE family toxin n=1 Tax=Merismopedia glauca CCAP 1448/3 TaxID=1296344 RepID=A0A2T1BY38_9CYAN|nr:type II toxin-antitoxin system RelE/ParE family toxin [Merismopedia glauca]PSB00946.1 hypothetical protein C7B64_20880 [Merismopedia glauca CCAP 1448/3]